MILDKKPTFVWTHACHQKIASGTKIDQETTKVNTAKVWFGRVPVDKIALSMFLIINKALTRQMLITRSSLKKKTVALRSKLAS